MDGTLKTISVPLLRERGFKGTYPHFYRVIGSHVDLLMFQFRLDGSSFVVEISYADPDRNNVGFRPETPVKQLQVSATRKRCRLGAKGQSGVDGTWFPLDHGPLTTQATHFKRLALKVNELLLEEAEPWWEVSRHGT
jgi:hypothetical protein